MGCLKVANKAVLWRRLGWTSVHVTARKTCSSVFALCCTQFLLFVSCNICTFQHFVYINLATDYVLTCLFYMSGLQKCFCSLATDFLNMDFKSFIFVMLHHILHMCFLFCKLRYQNVIALIANIFIIILIFAVFFFDARELPLCIYSMLYIVTAPTYLYV